MLRKNFNFRSFLIPRYIVGAMAPYILLSILLLTAILLAQQAARLAEVVIYTDLPFSLLVGLLFTGATTYLHLKEAPEATRDLERIALQGALAKLDSPVEPRTFSALPKYVIYVRDGNKELGTWGRVFIFAQRSDRTTEVFTARSGRIDSSGEQSELVLTDVLATKFPSSRAEPTQTEVIANTPNGNGDEKSYVVERSDQLRFSINTGR